MRAENENAPEGDAVDYAFFATANKLALADANIASLAVTLDRAAKPSKLASDLDLNKFRQTVPAGTGILLRQFNLNMPAMRYAVRLGAGHGGGPHDHHGVSAFRACQLGAPDHCVDHAGQFQRHHPSVAGTASPAR